MCETEVEETFEEVFDEIHEHSLSLIMIDEFSNEIRIIVK